MQVNETEEILGNLGASLNQTNHSDDNEENGLGSNGQEVPLKRIRVDLPSAKMRTYKSIIKANSKRRLYELNLEDLFHQDPKISIQRGLVIIVAGQGHGKSTLLNILKEQFIGRLSEKEHLYLEPNLSENDKEDHFVSIKAFESDYVDMGAEELADILIQEEESDVLTTKFPRMTIKSSVEALNAAIHDPSVRVVFFDGLRFLNSEAKGTPAIKEGVLRGVFDSLTTLSSYITAHNKLVIATLGTDTNFEVTNELYFERTMATVPLVLRPFIHEGFMKVMMTARTKEERRPVTHTLKEKKGLFNNAKHLQQASIELLDANSDVETVKVRGVIETEERLGNIWSNQINY